MAARTPLVIDISHHNIVTSFTEVRMAGIRGVIHKATEGATMVDKTAAKRRQQILDAGLLLGFYHFGDNSTVKTQVSNFLRVAQPDDSTLLALDWEPAGNGRRTMSLDQAKEWLALVHEKTGQMSLLYSGSTIKEALDGRPDPFLSQHRLWLCHYNSNPKLPVGFDKYWLWQYTGDGVGNGPHTVAGVKDKGLDLNVFGGSDLAQEWVCRLPRNVVALHVTLPNPPSTTPQGIPAADPPKDVPVKRGAVETIKDSPSLKMMLLAKLAGLVAILDAWWDTILGWVDSLFGILPEVSDKVNSVQTVSQSAGFTMTEKAAMALVAILLVILFIRQLSQKRTQPAKVPT